jgi:hypothetical protein
MPTNGPQHPAASTAATASPAAAALELRPALPGDGEAIHALLVANIAGVLEDRGRWLRRWQWQCWDNPFRQGRPAGWVMVDGERIVGHLGAVYVPLRVGRERKLGMIGADYAVIPDAVARGGTFAGLQLAQAFFASADQLVPLATSANDKTEAVFARFGCTPVPWTREFWRVPTTLAQQVRTCRGAASRVTRRLLTKPGGSILAGLAGLLYRAAGRRPVVPVPPDCRLETTTPRLACDLGRLDERAAEEVMAASQDALPVAVDRTSEYLDWRYAQHPERSNLSVLVLRSHDGSAAGAAVVFSEDRGPRRLAFVEDLIAPAGRPDVARTLLAAALGLAADRQADYLVTMTGRQELRPLYWELGFESRTRSAPAAVINCPPRGVEPSPLAIRLELWHGAMF